MAESRRLEVESAGDGERLDAWVADRLDDLSRSRAAQLIAEGRIRLNGEPAKKSERLEAGDVVEVEVPEPEPSGVEPEAIPLELVYEDDALAVVNKPAGLVVHPAPGHRTGTMVNALLHHLDDLSGIGGVKRPGIVHRLDKDTSGLLIVAKHDQAHRRLSAALKRRAIHRIYLAASWGHLDEDRVTVDAPVGRSHRNRKRMAVVEDGRRAVTHFRRLERWVAADLLEAELESGRTHQIRVHLTHIGHPVIGDELYGAGGAKGISGPGHVWARELERKVPRQFLHAHRLVFDHPVSGDRMAFEAPLPGPLAEAAAWAAASSR
ncbi:MAG: RluA family pseudouridine synthase [Longimicrobiales bacterium]|nr:RluA family pseudouridine synthase [Longimicrobiales bacterium]